MKERTRKETKEGMKDGTKDGMKEGMKGGMKDEMKERAIEGKNGKKIKIVTMNVSDEEIDPEINVGEVDQEVVTTDDVRVEDGEVVIEITMTAIEKDAVAGIVTRGGAVVVLEVIVVKDHAVEVVVVKDHAVEVGAEIEIVEEVEIAAAIVKKEDLLGKGQNVRKAVACQERDQKKVMLGKLI